MEPLDRIIKPRGVKPKGCIMGNLAQNATNTSAGNKPDDQQDEGKSNGEPNKSFSQEDVDKIVAKRVSEANSKTEETISKKIAEAQADWERKQKLTDEEKKREESDARNNELAEKERNLAIRENRAEARELLQEKNISADLVDWVVDVDADKTKENIEKLEKHWNKAIEEAVEKKLAGKTPTEKPKPNNSDDEKKSTKDLLYKKG